MHPLHVPFLNTATQAGKQTEITPLSTLMPYTAIQCDNSHQFVILYCHFHFPNTFCNKPSANILHASCQPEASVTSIQALPACVPRLQCLSSCQFSHRVPRLSTTQSVTVASLENSHAQIRSTPVLKQVQQTRQVQQTLGLFKPTRSQLEPTGPHVCKQQIFHLKVLCNSLFEAWCFVGVHNMSS